MESTTAETQQIVSSSEALARLLRDEMERQDEELSQRRHVAEDGLAVRFVHRHLGFDLPQKLKRKQNTHTHSQNTYGHYLI